MWRHYGVISGGFTTDRFLFAGFLPAEAASAILTALQKLAAETATLVFLGD